MIPAPRGAGGARRLRVVAAATLLAIALLLVQAASASADVFDGLGGSFSGPSISSDKPDYAPGETVVLSGSGWVPGEHVHITVNDDIGQTWIRESDVTADDGGSINDQFQLPDSFIALYAVTAVGDASGTARTTFTDGNVKVLSASGRHFNFTSTLYTGSQNCTGTAGAPASGTGDNNGSTVGVGNNQSILITANLNANSPNASSIFSNWTRPADKDGNTIQFASGYSATDRTVCVIGFQSGSMDLVGNYLADATPPQVLSINRGNANPTNTAGNVSWTVTFSESVTGVDATDFELVNTGLAGTPAITAVTGTGATRTVTASTGTGSGTLKLNLNDDDAIVDAAGNMLGGAGTGVVGGGGLGNGSFEGQAYTIDRAAPTIAATAVTLPDNSPYTANTWTNKSVRVTFTCTDSGGSGTATDTATGNTDVTAETTSSGTTVNSSGTCIDNAGNSAAGASFGPIKIDKTAPSISDLGPTSSPNGAGWYQADVTNRFRASDSLSGPNGACETAFPDMVTGGREQSKTTSIEGVAVKVSSSSCSDVAGNTAAAVDSAEFKIDKSAPSITNVGPTSAPNGAGWYKTNVTNKFKASDSLSGPNGACETAFPDVVSGGREQSKTTTGEGLAVKVPSDGCTDVAGNTAAAIDSAEFKIDKTAPSITDLGPTTEPNGAGWYKTDVDNEFKASDSLSGPDSACLTAFPEVGGDRVQSKTTSGQSTAEKVTSSTCSDVAGNTAAAIDSAEFKVDKTAPSITDLGPTTDPNEDDWYKTDVTNKFKASDSLSGPNGACETAFPDVVADGREQSKTTISEGNAVTVSSDECTDEAGNTTDPIDSAAFKIDTTGPTITDLGPTTPPNGAGWYKTDVVNEFRASDAGSGLDDACQTAFPDAVPEGREQSKTTSGEGTAKKVTSSPCSDVAGNAAAAIDSAEFKVDKTAPTISDEGPTTQPNGAGWYQADVTNKFRASDSLSGPNGACETAFPDVVPGGREQLKTTTGQGLAVKVPSSSCTDVAGNTAAAVDSAEFKIDKTAPSITDIGPTSNPNLAGWYKTDVTNRFRASDSLSGPNGACETAFPDVVLDGREQSKTTTGESAAVKVSSSSCTDVAGNTAAAIDSAEFKIDKTAPSITDLGPTTDPNLAGWYKTDVTNRFQASDSLSGPDGDCLTAYPEVTGDRIQSKTTSGQGTAQKVSSDGCTDVAGNAAAAIDSTEFKIDKTAPSITDLGPTTEPNANDWYKADVTNRFKASDSLSGPNSACETAFPDVVADGREQSKTTTGESAAIKVSSSSCTDVAGNEAAAIDSTEFKIDKTSPTISNLGPTTSPNLAGWYKTDVTNGFKASDSLSGPDSDCLTAYPAVGGDRIQSKTTTGEGLTVKVSSSSCTDDAGNTAAAIDSAVFKIDQTEPSITDLGPTTDPNANDWYKTDVDNQFKASDSLSGPDSACLTAFPDVSGDRIQSKTTIGEGNAVTVSSDECTDEAGNTAAATASAAFQIDQTDPTITDLGPTTSPNLAGWYKADVDNEFKASDSLSGLDSACLTAFPEVTGDRIQSKTTTGEGTAVTVSSDECTDEAGNTAAAIDSAEFQIDKSAPASHADSPTATNQSPFTVEYTASDQALLSGLEKVELHVRTPEVGTGYVLAATDNTPSGSGESFTYTPDAGEGTYRFYTVAYDVAGNVETSPVSYDTVTDVETGTPDTTTIFDQTAPVTTDDADANWHNSAVTVTLTATDESGGSGVDKTFYKVDGAASFTEGTSVVIDAPADHSNDGTHTIYYYSTDKAGNEELANEATVKIDTAAPTVEYLSAAPAANANGWRNVDVTATFKATDGLSGFTGPSSTKTDTATTTGEGLAVTVGSPAFTDLAGNTAAASTAVSEPFKIDKTKPTLSPVVTPNPVLLGGTATVASNAADALSTLDTQTCGALNTSTVNTKSVTCTATDKAGNTDSKTALYSVQYGWNGFLQPINDTAHQTGLTQSRFKLGSTVPAKFVLRNAAGQIVQQTTNPTFSRTVRLRTCDANATTEPTSTDLSPDGGASYVWDGTQYHYNWSTKGIKDVGVYRIYANLADGTQRWVDICLW